MDGEIVKVMFDVTFYTFIAIGIVLMILEIFTPTSFFFFSIGISSLLVSVVAIFIKDPKILILILSLLSLLITYIINKTKILSSRTDFKSNTDNYTGKKVRVLEKKDEEIYRVKVYSEVWNAISDDILEIGDEAEILRTEGSTFVVKKIK